MKSINKKKAGVVGLTLIILGLSGFSLTYEGAEQQAEEIVENIVEVVETAEQEGVEQSGGSPGS